MKNVKRIGGIVVTLFLISMLLIAIYKRHLLLSNFAFTTGTVSDVTLPGWKGSGDFSILYEYSVNGIMYKSNNNYSYCHGQSIAKLKSLLMRKQFPVAYAVRDATTVNIL